MKRTLNKLTFFIILLGLISIFGCDKDSDNTVMEETNSKEVITKDKIKNNKTASNFGNFQIYYMNENDVLVQISLQQYKNFLENERGVSSSSIFNAINIEFAGSVAGIKTISSNIGEVSSIFHTISPIGGYPSTALRISGTTCECASTGCSWSGCEASVVAGCSCSACDEDCTKTSTATSDVFSAVAFL